VISSGDTRLIPEQLVSKSVFNEANKEVVDKQIVVDGGGTNLNCNELVTNCQLELENEAAKKRGLRPAEVRPAQPAIARLKAEGITASSVTGDSFIAAASFQETIKSLIRAVISGQVDKLRGIKENISVGKLFPAGTGLPKYDRLRIPSKEVELSLSTE